MAQRYGFRLNSNDDLRESATTLTLPLLGVKNQPEKYDDKEP